MSSGTIFDNKFWVAAVNQLPTLETIDPKKSTFNKDLFVTRIANIIFNNECKKIDEVKNNSLSSKLDRIKKIIESQANLYNFKEHLEAKTGIDSVVKTKQDFHRNYIENNLFFEQSSNVKAVMKRTPAIVMRNENLSKFGANINADVLADDITTTFSGKIDKNSSSSVDMVVSSMFGWNFCCTEDRTLGSPSMFCAMLVDIIIRNIKPMDVVPKVPKKSVKKGDTSAATEPEEKINTLNWFKDQKDVCDIAIYYGKGKYEALMASQYLNELSRASFSGNPMSISRDDKDNFDVPKFYTLWLINKAVNSVFYNRNVDVSGLKSFGSNKEYLTFKFDNDGNLVLAPNTKLFEWKSIAPIFGINNVVSFTLNPDEVPEEFTKYTTSLVSSGAVTSDMVMVEYLFNKHFNIDAAQDKTPEQKKKFFQRLVADAYSCAIYTLLQVALANWTEYTKQVPFSAQINLETIQLLKSFEKTQNTLLNSSYKLHTSMADRVSNYLGTLPVSPMGGTGMVWDKHIEKVIPNGSTCVYPGDRIIYELISSYVDALKTDIDKSLDYNNTTLEMFKTKYNVEDYKTASELNIDDIYREYYNILSSYVSDVTAVKQTTQTPSLELIRNKELSFKHKQVMLGYIKNQYQILNYKSITDSKKKDDYIRQRNTSIQDFKSKVMVMMGNIKDPKLLMFVKEKLYDVTNTNDYELFEQKASINSLRDNERSAKITSTEFWCSLFTNIKYNKSNSIRYAKSIGLSASDMCDHVYIMVLDRPDGVGYFYDIGKMLYDGSSSDWSQKKTAKEILEISFSEKNRGILLYKSTTSNEYKAISEQALNKLAKIAGNKLGLIRFMMYSGLYDFEMSEKMFNIPLKCGGTANPDIQLEPGVVLPMFLSDEKIKADLESQIGQVSGSCYLLDTLLSPASAEDSKVTGKLKSKEEQKRIMDIRRYMIPKNITDIKQDIDMVFTSWM